jgi:HAD superfamily hydrolase (TIGR01549 family)
MLTAILWDYDGTLVDSAAKNRAVTMEVLRRVDPALLTPLPTALRSVEAYRTISRQFRNWAELYEKNYRMTPEQTAQAAPLWSTCQQADDTPSPLFDGMAELLERFRDTPMGICSQNHSETMRAELERSGAAQYFGAIAGFNTVGLPRQKPLPDTFLRCLELLNLPESGTFAYIGDQAEDIQFARAASQVMWERGSKAEIFCIAALWSGAETEHWPIQPDFRAQTPAELGSFLRLL